MTVEDLLAEAAKKCVPANFSGLAKALNVEPSAISNWRKGRALPDPVRCAKLADMLGLPLHQVIGLVGEARAISREEKAVWRRIGAAAAVACIAVALTPEDASLAVGWTLMAVDWMHYANFALAVIATWAVLRWRHGSAPVLA